MIWSMSKTEIKKQNRKNSPKDPYQEVITTHINADFDALSSMMAAKKLYPDATLVFPGAQEKNLRNFFLHSTSYLFDFEKIKNAVGEYLTDKEIECVLIRRDLVIENINKRIEKLGEASVLY